MCAGSSACRAIVFNAKNEKIMYKQIIFIAASILLNAACGGNGQAPADSPAAHDHAHAHAHDHSGHNHGDHDGHGHEGHDHAGHGHAAEKPVAEAASGGESDEIIFPPAQAALTDFKVEEVCPGPFSDVIRASGRILPAQGDQVCLSAPVDGIVSFGAVKLTDGSPVQAGQSLFFISSKNIASGDANARITANYEKARAEMQRMEALLGDKIVTRKEYDAARVAYIEARGEYDAIAATNSARGTGVKVPITGYVSRLDVHEGDYVVMGQVLANVTRNRRMELRADVSQRYYAGLKNVRSASFRTPYDDQTLNIDDMNGRLVSIGHATEQSGYMIPVIFEFDNPGQLVAGSYVEISLLGARRDGVVSLPLTAITEQQGVFYVYVQVDLEGYRRREVRLGADDGERVAILSGLQPGERVVTRGAVHVRMAASSGAIPHGHSH